MKTIQLLECPVWLIISLLFIAASVTGCTEQMPTSSATDDDLAEIAEALEQHSETTDKRSVAQSPSTNIELKLNAGDRFPLVKTIQQELSQTSGDKVKKSTSQIELVMTITVEEINGDQKRLGVRYTRVKYRHNVNGDEAEYDSHYPPLQIPAVVRPYHGLVNNGFSFWIGPDNTIVSVVGMEEFLEACLRGVGSNQREQVMRQILRVSAKDGLANFVDDSIGLLPYKSGDQARGSMFSIGETWRKERRLQQPIPMRIEQTFTLKDISANQAKIDVGGRITPLATPPVATTGRQQVSVDIEGGTTSGSCTIDLSTGLPIESQVDQHLDMLVTVDGGHQFRQQKHVLTTIRAFPQQTNADASHRSLNASEIQTTSYETGAR